MMMMMMMMMMLVMMMMMMIMMVMMMIIVVVVGGGGAGREVALIITQLPYCQASVVLESMLPCLRPLTAEECSAHLLHPHVLSPE